MNIVFGSTGVIQSNFTMTTAFVGVLVVMVVTGFHLSYRNDPKAMKLGTRCLVGLLVWAGVSYASYVSNYRRFIRADITPQQITLHFAGTFYGDVVLPGNDVSEVTFGFPDRGVGACNISIVEKSNGRRYQSVFTRNDNDTCKQMRLQIMQLLGLPQ